MVKRGQMEIIGILIIIVLMILGLLFLLRFSGSGDQDDLAKRIKNKEIASNMLNAILNSDAKSCRELRLTDLVRDCAENIDYDQCSGGGSIVCPSPDGSGTNVCSCRFIEKTFINIFEQTLDVWQIKYNFNMVKGEEPLVQEIGVQCEGGSDVASYWVPATPVPANLLLRICD